MGLRYAQERIYRVDDRELVVEDRPGFLTAIEGQDPLYQHRTLPDE